MRRLPVWSWLKHQSVQSSSAGSRNAAVELTLDEMLDARGERHWNRRRSLEKGYRTGDLRSRRRGAGLELDSIGPYQPGDDIRLMDWQATARTGKAQIRRFNVEVQRSIILLLDLRSAMFFGSHHRLLAKTACLAGCRAAFQFSIQQQVGWACLSGERSEVLPLARGRRARLVQLQRIVQCYMRALDNANEPSETLDSALARLVGKLPTTADILLFSDFSNCGSALAARLIELGRPRTSAIVIDDEMGRRAPKPGVYPLQNAGDRLPSNIRVRLASHQSLSRSSCRKRS